MEHVHRHIPNRLRKHRRIMGYQQKDVARLLGLQSANRISRWEKGVALPSAINLIKLSIVFRTLPTELYFDVLQQLREELHQREKKLHRVTSDERNNSAYMF